MLGSSNEHLAGRLHGISFRLATKPAGEPGEFTPEAGLGRIATSSAVKMALADWLFGLS